MQPGFAVRRLVPFLTLAMSLLAPPEGAVAADNAAAPAAIPAQTPKDADGALESLLALPVLDLGPLDRAVLERNPSLEAMRSAWRASEARADQAGGLLESEDGGVG